MLNQNGSAPPALSRQRRAYPSAPGRRHYFKFARNRHTNPARVPLDSVNRYSAAISPEPPNSFGKSLNFGSPSRIGSTVSA